MFFKKFIKSYILGCYRKHKLKMKILKILNLCLYDEDSGEKYKPILNIENDKYNVCSGKVVKRYKKIFIEICEKGFSFGYMPIISFNKNGRIVYNDGRYKIKKLDNGKKYIKRC